jgi:hypothetical protein
MHPGEHCGEPVAIFSGVSTRSHTANCFLHLSSMKMAMAIMKKLKASQSVWWYDSDELFVIVRLQFVYRLVSIIDSAPIAYMAVLFKKQTSSRRMCWANAVVVTEHACWDLSKQSNTFA